MISHHVSSLHITTDLGWSSAPTTRTHRARYSGQHPISAWQHNKQPLSQEKVFWDTTTTSQPCHEMFHPGQGTQSQFMGLRQNLGLAESGSQRKAVLPCWGKAGLKYERAWSPAMAHLGLLCSIAHD